MLKDNRLPSDSRSILALVVVVIALISYSVLVAAGHTPEAKELLQDAGLPALTLFVGLESNTRDK